MCGIMNRVMTAYVVLEKLRNVDFVIDYSYVIRARIDKVDDEICVWCEFGADKQLKFCILITQLD